MIYNENGDFMEELFNKLKINPKDLKLYERAFSHSSYANEHKSRQDYERLEFLGDAVVDLVVADYLYANFKETEGEMTKVRATVVCEASLYKIAKQHKFSEYLYIGKSEQQSKGNEKPAILADSVEAVIAAIYLDGGLEPACKFIIENLKDEIAIATQHVGEKDYKTMLQEKLQEHGNVKITYKIIKETGPDHNKTFEAEVELNGKELAKGKGKSKKLAEMSAAKKALENL